MEHKQPNVFKGTLDIYDGCNGLYLYGYGSEGVTFLAALGDGVDTPFADKDYDPNDDPYLAEAYDFKVI